MKKALPASSTTLADFDDVAHSTLIRDSLGLHTKRPESTSSVPHLHRDRDRQCHVVIPRPIHVQPVHRQREGTGFHFLG